MLERKKNNNQFDRILIVSPIRNLSVKKIQQQKSFPRIQVRTGTNDAINGYAVTWWFALSR